MIGDLIARKKFAQLIGTIRPARAEDANTLVERAIRRGPFVQQVVDSGKKLFLRRIPRLHQIVVHACLVDGVDGRVGVRIRGKQGALGERVHLHGFGKEIHAVHLGHALIGEQQSHGIVARFQFPQRGEAGASGIRAHDAVAIRIAAAQVALNGPQDFRVVIYCQ